VRARRLVASARPTRALIAEIGELNAAIDRAPADTESAMRARERRYYLLVEVRSRGAGGAGDQVPVYDEAFGVRLLPHL
jgi:hypothetical protein